MTLEEYADAKAKHERKMINELFQRLIEDGRLDEMLAATKDDELQDKLLKEYNLE